MLLLFLYALVDNYGTIIATRASNVYICFINNLQFSYYGRTLSERPCYILPMFFSYIFFYFRLSWPNG